MARTFHTKTEYTTVPFASKIISSILNRARDHAFENRTYLDLLDKISHGLILAVPLGRTGRIKQISYETILDIVLSKSIEFKQITLVNSPAGLNLARYMHNVISKIAELNEQQHISDATALQLIRKVMKHIELSDLCC